MKNLKCINGRWKIRLRVPDECRQVIGKQEFVKSLGPISKSQAEHLAHQYLSEWKLEILKARNTPLTPHFISHVPEKLRTQTREHFKKTAEFHGWLDGQSDKDSVVLDVATKSAAMEGVVPDESQASKDAVAEALGFYCVPERHIDEYIRIKLQDIKPRSRNEHISVLRNELFKKLPKFDSSFDRFKVTKWWESYQEMDKPPSASTLRKYRSHISSYVSWLISRGYTDKVNFFADLPNISKREAARKRRKPERKAFDEDDLVRLFKEMNLSSRNEALRNLVLIAIYTGCRIEELCQLTDKDIFTNDQGQSYIDIPESKTQKGEHRKVPIHPLIWPLFENKTGHIIDVGPIKNQYNERSGPIGKKFSRLKIKLGYGEDKVFHSLRKTFINKLKENDTPEVLAADIVGHEIGTMTYGVYSTGAPVSKLYEHVQKVSYPVLEKLLVQQSGRPT